MLRTPLPSASDQPIPAADKPRSPRFNKIWLVPALAVLLAAGGGAVWLHGQQSGSTITWSQPQILEFLLPQQKKTLTLTFRSNQNLSKVVTFVAPALSSVLTVSPTSFSQIAANQNYQVTLSVKAPTQSEVKFDGTVQIKATIGSSTTYAQPLPLTVVVHGQPEPPDPGAAGEQTVAGIDSDHDGVRDDVQRFVIISYLGTQDRTSAGLQYAASLQSYTLGTASQRVEVLATRCVVFAFGYAGATAALKAIRDVQINTSSRLSAYLRGQSQLATLPFPQDTGVPGAACTR